MTLVGLLTTVSPSALAILGFATVLVHGVSYAVVQVVRTLAPQQSADRRAVWFALKDGYIALLAHRRWIHRHTNRPIPLALLRHAPKTRVEMMRRRRCRPVP